MIDTIHFRCAFDVRPVTDGEAGFSDLVEVIARWIWSKDSTLDLKPSLLLTEGSTRRADGRASVTVDSIGAQTGGVAPDMWALRLEHQDSEFSPRRWVIDFGITRIEPQQWRFSIVVGNSLHPSYIGKEPGHLPVTAPRVVKDIVSSSKWRCTAGTANLTAVPVVVRVGKADLLVKAIEDPNRACPLVYVSLNRLTKEPALDPARLAATIVGAGVVHVATSTELDEEIEFLMVPREFRSPNGTVRVYAPGADFKLPWQAYRHRFFTRNQIEELTAAEVEGQIARALTRRQGWGSVRSSVSSIEDVGGRRRELRRMALQGQTDSASQDELRQLFEGDNVRLATELAKLTTEKDNVDQQVEELDMQIEEQRDRIRRVEYESETFRTEAVEAKRQVAALAEAVDTARGIRQLPKNTLEVAELIEHLHADTIVLTSEAKQSASESTIDPAVAWECLHATATVLPDLIFNQGGTAIADEFRNRTGFELTLTEGKQTKKDSKLADLRRVTVNGREWDISAHVKAGKHPDWLRIHFAIDRDTKRIIVGHCGDHLETAGTRRRK